MPVVYAENLQSLLIFLQDNNFIPYNRLAEFFELSFGVKISEGTIMNIESKVASNLTDYYDELQTIAVEQKQLNVDETGKRNN